MPLYLGETQAKNLLAAQRDEMLLIQECFFLLKNRQHLAINMPAPGLQALGDC